MGTLIIMRHAEAVRAAPGDDDFTRPLTAAGRAAAAHAAQRIHATHGALQLLLHSPALRTTETAHIVARTASPARVAAVPAIYRTRGRALLQLIDRPDFSADCVLLIGHNPGVSELLRLLNPADARTERWLSPAEFVALAH